MSFTTTSPNMSLTIPTVSLEPGPTYASDINASLTTIDQHDHSSGKGVAITPLGISITSDLSFGGNNVTQARSVRFTAQGSPISTASDIGCLYESGVDLYYNDGSGNQIRLTQSGGVSGSPGSITGLSAPASVTYNAPTYVFQSAVNTAGNLDGRNLILRNSAASSSGLTLSPPAAMASDFTITLPSLPATQRFLTIDNTGAIATPITYLAGITTSNIASNTIARSNINAASLYPKLNSTQITSNSNFVVGSYSYVFITGCGGGGGGGGGAAHAVNSGGGGAGGTGALLSPPFVLQVTAGETLTVIVGAGGAAGGGGGAAGLGGSGTNGSVSQILRGATVLFKFSAGSAGGGGAVSTGAAATVTGVTVNGSFTNGGAGGDGGGSGAAGQAGQGNVPFNQNGGAGGAGAAGGGGGGGGGGSSSYGAGGAGAAGGLAAGNPGQVGQGYGAGGGGGGGANNSGSPGSQGNAGGPGAAGVVNFSWIDWG